MKLPNNDLSSIALLLALHRSYPQIRVILAPDGPKETVISPGNNGRSGKTVSLTLIKPVTI